MLLEDGFESLPLEDRFEDLLVLELVKDLSLAFVCIVLIDDTKGLEFTGLA